MTELIKVTDGTVSARELHRFLGYSGHYSKWISDILQYGFVEGKDYVESVGYGMYRRKQDDYAISLSAAREITLLYRSRRARLARTYFLSYEKDAGTRQSTHRHVHGFTDLMHRIASLEDKIDRITAGMAFSSGTAAMSSKIGRCNVLAIQGITPTPFLGKYPTA